MTYHGDQKIQTQLGGYESLDLKLDRLDRRLALMNWQLAILMAGVLAILVKI